jgi:hypothetical protein
MFSQLIAGKQQQTFVVVLSPVQIPVSWKLFVVIEHARDLNNSTDRRADLRSSDDLPRGQLLPSSTLPLACAFIERHFHCR